MIESARKFNPGAVGTTVDTTLLIDLWFLGVCVAEILLVVLAIKHS